MINHHEERNTMHSNVTKFTVNITPAAMAALNAASGDLSDTQTDTINRALQLYRHIMTLAPGESVSFDRLPGERVTLMRITESKEMLA